jgi:hypothetical protein
LVVNIIIGIYSNTVRTNAINIAFDYYTKNKKYFLAANIINHYNSNSTREDKIIILLNNIYQDENEKPIRSESCLQDTLEPEDIITETENE